MVEVFVGEGRLGLAYEKHSGKKTIRLGYRYGQDFNRAKDRRLLKMLLECQQPEHVWISFP